MRDTDPRPYPMLYIPVRRPPPYPTNNNSNPMFGFYVAGKLTKKVDGESVEQDDVTPSPKSVNRFSKGRYVLKGVKKPCGKCGSTTYVDIRGACCDKCMMSGSLKKAEVYPYRLYDQQRRDVIKMIKNALPEIEPDNIAMKPAANGYVGILYDGSEGLSAPYLFSITSLTGVQVRKSKDVDNAFRMHQHFLDVEQRLSKKLLLRETSQALHDFSVRLSKAFPVTKEPKVKQAKPMPNAGRKIAGATGKTRYNYSQQGKEKGQPGAKGAKPKGQTPAAKPKGAPSPRKPGDEVSPVQEAKPVVDPANLATMLHTTTEVIRKVAMRFAKNSKLGGKNGFVRFFTKRFEALVKKHNIRSQYLRILYDVLTAPEPHTGLP